MAERTLYIDRLRVAMTALVICHHAAITYGAAGGWFHYEQHFDGSPASQLLTFFTGVNQAWFMGAFFLLAGLYTPGSIARKGILRFLGDRFLRLGLPLALFALLLAPLTVCLDEASKGNPPLRVLTYLWQHHVYIPGPLWFAEALLLFAVVAAAFNRLGSKPQTVRPLPGYGWWLLSALFVGAFALLLRQFMPTGKDIFGLQIGYFSSYIFLFALGCVAARHQWLEQLSWQRARPWVWTAVVFGPLLPVVVAVAIRTQGLGHTNFNGGLGLTAIFYALWEPFIAWGILAGLLVSFRKRFNQPSRVAEWLGRRAYAVYFVHPPVLVAVSLALHPVALPALLKFMVASVVSVAACWLLADPLVRLPGLRRIF